MRTISLELGLNFNHNNELIKQRYDELVNDKSIEFKDRINVYLDLRLGQFYVVFVFKDFASKRPLVRDAL